MLTVVERGADQLAGAGRIGDDTAQAVKAEVHRPVDTGTLFGHIACAAVFAGRALIGSAPRVRCRGG
jgi:hypothetical protein